MYMENNRRAAGCRADADFLRRLLGGVLTGHDCGRPCGRDRAPMQPRQGYQNDCCEWAPQARQEEAPLRPENGCGCQKPCNTSCPTEIHAPALAMVYCPRQCWRKLFDPADGLKHGTIFAELVLPFEAVPHNGGKEGCARRPM